MDVKIVGNKLVIEVALTEPRMSKSGKVMLYAVDSGKVTLGDVPLKVNVLAMGPKLVK